MPRDVVPEGNLIQRLPVQTSLATARRLSTALACRQVGHTQLSRDYDFPHFFPCENCTNLFNGARGGAEEEAEEEHA